MVKSFLILITLVSFSAHADLFDFGPDKARESKIPALTEKLKGLELKDDPAFEETFNQTIKSIENGLEEEKLYCLGEVSDSAGKTLPPAQKQYCMRELKKQYLEATDVIFDMKKKYLGLIHQRQMKKLSEIQKQNRADIEKNF